ncbi:chromosome partitioning protein [Salinibacter ruber]|uniref:ParA family protein n=1 Tax=Salinibacter ruber TaxID=146919 RepID=UPI002167E308|nr:ParA family protein [Salinibacter ruber]MCS4116027.1 chromosome partitioning protein [Salinibacter ruber]
MYTLTVAIQKGGTGKSTTLVGLGEAVHQKGRDVLAIDLDPQANLTRWMLGGPIADEEPDITTVLDGEVTIGDVVFPTDHGPDLVPTSQHLSLTAQTIGQMTQLRERALNNSLSGYDLILIDTPPYIGSLVFNALSASDSVLIPIQLEGPAITGLKTFGDAIAHVRSEANPNLGILGIFANQLDVRRRTTKDGWKQLKDEYGEYLLSPRLRQRAAISDAATYREPLLENGDDHTRDAFNSLADIVIDRANL